MIGPLTSVFGERWNHSRWLSSPISSIGTLFLVEDLSRRMVDSSTGVFSLSWSRWRMRRMRRP